MYAFIHSPVKPIHPACQCRKWLACSAWLAPKTSPWSPPTHTPHRAPPPPCHPLHRSIWDAPHHRLRLSPGCSQQLLVPEPPPSTGRLRSQPLFWPACCSCCRPLPPPSGEWPPGWAASFLSPPSPPPPLLSSVASACRWRARPPLPRCPCRRRPLLPPSSSKWPPGWAASLSFSNLPPLPPLPHHPHPQPLPSPACACRWSPPRSCSCSPSPCSSCRRTRVARGGMLGR